MHAVVMPTHVGITVHRWRVHAVLRPDANASHAATISSDHSQVIVAIEPTNEEWIAASHALSCLDREKAR